ncbi:hypothetical protein LTR46_008983 [Exophiala xenobiotica]|nr:hypothetical protein LTR46_008983 [Exophiala xenobiotica]
MGSKAAMWNSVWLSKLTIFGILVTSASCVAALTVLFYFNTRNDGFLLYTTNHYSWTYGPTAVLVLIVSVWRQVDHGCKVLVPWQNLGKGDAECKGSVLLDYVSPLQMVTLWKAAGNRHLLICTTILGFLLLKVVTVASTGLFAVDSHVVSTSDVRLATKTSFDGSLYNSSRYLSVTDSSSFYTAYAVMAKGLADTEGTLGTLAYQSLSLPPIFSKDNTTASATVEVFAPSFNCEKAQVSINLQPANTTDQHPEDTINLLSPPCKLLAGAVPVYALNPQLYACPTRQLSGLMQRVDCSGQNSSAPVGNWQLLTMTDMRYEQTLDSDSDGTDLSDFQALTWSTGVANVSAIVCSPSYTIQKRIVNYAFSGNGTRISLGSAVSNSSRSLDEFSDADLGAVFTSAYTAASLMFGNKADNETAGEYPDTMFRTMAEVAGGSYETLLDPEVMMSTAEKVFNHVAVQIAHKNLVRNDTSSVTGTTVTTEQRLFIRQPSLWIMVVGFSVLTIMSVLILIMLPLNVVAYNPEEISSTALILADSAAFEDILSTGEPTDAEGLNQVLSAHTYGLISSVDVNGHQNFAIHVSGNEFQANQQATISEHQVWWCPLLLKRPVIMLILALPLALVAVLEVLQHLSSRTMGISTLTNPAGIVTDISTRFLPALAMLLVSTSFNALDFNVAVLAPYHALRSGRDPDSSIVTSIVGKMPLSALWTAFRSRYWSAFVSSVGVFLGSILAIIVSGLLVVDPVSTTQETVLQVMDGFQPMWENSVINDNSAAVVVSLIEAANLSYPSFTHEDLAFPRLHTGNNISTSTNENSMITVQTPSYRGSLMCGILRPDQFNVSESYNPAILTSGASVQASVPLPPECPYGGPGGNLTSMEYEYFFQLPANTNQSFIGRILDLHVGPFSGAFADSSDEISPYTQPDNPAGCPSLAFIYGYIDVVDTAKTMVSTMVCSQVLEKLDAQVTLDARDLSISTSRPPVANESTAALLASGPENQTTNGRTTPTAFPFRIQVHMDQTLSMFNQTEYSSSSISSQPPVDNFFQAVLFGRRPVPQDLMRQSDEVSQNQVRQGIQNFYRRYMAQAISANMRVNISKVAASAAFSTETVVQTTGTSSQSGLPATLVNVPAHVLRQNETSKIILQCLLGTMFACGLAAVLLNPTQKVVPHNPCTIAGSASLLAGSGLVRELAVASATEGRMTVLRRRKLRLGWWSDHGSVEQHEPHDGQSTRRRYGIDLVPEN